MTLSRMCGKGKTDGDQAAKKHRLASTHMQSIAIFSFMSPQKVMSYVMPYPSRCVSTGSEVLIPIPSGDGF